MSMEVFLKDKVDSVSKERDRYVERMRLLELRLEAIKYITDGLLDDDLKQMRPGAPIRLRLFDTNLDNAVVYEHNWKD